MVRGPRFIDARYVYTANVLSSSLSLFPIETGIGHRKETSESNAAIDETSAGFFPKSVQILTVR